MNWKLFRYQTGSDFIRLNEKQSNQWPRAGGGVTVAWTLVAATPGLGSEKGCAKFHRTRATNRAEPVVWR